MPEIGPGFSQFTTFVSMITIDQSRCTLCGLCVRICHEYCMHIEGESLRIEHAFCSTCSQCAAICPTRALSWDHIPPDKYNRDLLPGPEELDELLKERRTIRDFSAKKVPREVLEEIVHYAVYAPAHSFSFRVIITDDDAVIREIDASIFRRASRLHRWLFKPRYFHAVVRLIAPGWEQEYLKARPKLEAAYARGRNFRSIPPAIVMIIADSHRSLVVESAQYALYAINLAAHTRGLGCRNLVGNQMFLNRDRSIRRMLGIRKHEKIAGTMAVGYPSVRFRNKVQGKKADIHWIGP